MKNDSFSRRSALKLLASGASLSFFKASTVLAARSETPTISRRDGEESTLLFFDDEALYHRQAVTRRLGEPVRQSSFHERAGNCTWGRPAVFRLTDGTWRMVYQAGVGRRNRGGGVVLLAASEDGLAWQPLDTRERLELPQRLVAHQVLPVSAGSYCSTFEDPKASPDERYKLLATVENEHTSIWTSPDLLHWRRRPGSAWHPSPPDPPAFMFWNDVTGNYVITTRPEWPDRRVCVVETPDWHDFTLPRLVSQANADDQPLAQHYGLYVRPYEGYFVGFLWVYYAGAAGPVLTPHRYRGGRVETYLMYSVNGVHWQRCFHTPLFRNGAPGSPDAGCLQISCLIEAGDGNLRAYGACSTSEHGILPPDDGHIVSYSLRRDGFVFFEAGDEPGLVCTRALFWRKGEGALNVSAANGLIRVRVVEGRGGDIPGFGFEECEPFSGDALSWLPQWRGGRKLSDLAGRMIRLEIRLIRARLYALRGSFVLSRLRDLERWEKTGSPPEPRAGF